MNLNDLIEWHKHNASECRKEGQEGERAFHELAVATLEKISSYVNPFTGESAL